MVDTKHGPPAATDAVTKHWIAPSKTGAGYANSVTEHVNVEVPVSAVKSGCLAGGRASEEFIVKLNQILKNSQDYDARQPILDLLTSVIDKLLLYGCVFESQAP